MEAEMHVIDTLWEHVLDCLSENDRLSKFYQIDKEDLKTHMNLYYEQAPSVLHGIYLEYLAEGKQAALHLVNSYPEDLNFVLLMIIGRSIKCWSETGLMASQNKRWVIANA